MPHSAPFWIEPELEDALDANRELRIWTEAHALPAEEPAKHVSAAAFGCPEPFVHPCELALDHFAEPLAVDRLEGCLELARQGVALEPQSRDACADLVHVARGLRQTYQASDLRTNSATRREVLSRSAWLRPARVVAIACSTA